MERICFRSYIVSRCSIFLYKKKNLFWPFMFAIKNLISTSSNSSLKEKSFSAPHMEVCFHMFSAGSLCARTGSAMATVAVIGSMLRSTTREGHRSEMKGGTSDTQQSQPFLGHVYTGRFIGPFVQCCINVLASVCRYGLCQWFPKLFWLMYSKALLDITTTSCSKCVHLN